MMKWFFPVVSIIVFLALTQVCLTRCNQRDSQRFCLAQTHSLNPKPHTLRSQIIGGTRLNAFRNYAAIVGLFIQPEARNLADEEVRSC